MMRLTLGNDEMISIHLSEEITEDGIPHNISVAMGSGNIITISRRKNGVEVRINAGPEQRIEHDFRLGDYRSTIRFEKNGG